MIKNPFAQPFFEFLDAHNLSLYRVAKVAGISEGTLRSYRDVEGRRLTRSKKIRVAHALCRLTRHPINVLYLFGDGSRSPDEDSSWIIRPDPNTKFSDFLWDRNIDNDVLPYLADVGENYIQALLAGKAIPKGVADRLCAALRVEPSEIGIEETVDDEAAYYNPKGPEGEPIEPSPNLYILQMHSAPWTNLNFDPDFPESAIEIVDRGGGLVPWPPALLGNPAAFALAVRFNDMAPRLEVGERIFIDPNAYPQPGADVLISFKETELVTGHIAVVRRLCDYSENAVLVRKYNPSGYDEIPKDRIKTINKILRTDELF